MTPEERATAALSLARELLEAFNTDFTDHGILTASLTRVQFTTRMDRLTTLEREDTT